MMRSLYAGVAGMRSQQTLMDVIGGNIANVGTIGYKAARVSFEDMLNETLRIGSAKTNPVQVGTGVQVGAITTMYNQGSLQSTGNDLDLCIAGKGFLVLDNQGERCYTRAASLSLNNQGWLVHTSTGNRVLGWPAAIDGSVRPGARLQALRARPGESSPACASTGIEFSGALDARLADGEVATRDVNVIDSIGRYHTFIVSYARTSSTEWDWSLEDEAGNAIVGASGTITFNADGTVAAGANANVTVPVDDRAADLTLALDFGALVQTGSDTSASGQQIGGVAAGTLRDVAVDEFGYLTGIFSNGTTRILGQLALAVFHNQEGLTRMGSNLFMENISSGAADTDGPPGAGRGKFSPGALEMSNVDLSQEFVSMIVSQRAFQANSRIVTTTDELLQEVVNLKR